jgi:hypothetical protein
MSCQCVLASGDYDGSPEFYSISEPKARKAHWCSECGKVVAVGEKYQRYTCKYYGDFSSSVTCLPCIEIARFFSCDGGWTPGDMWSDLQDHLFPQFHHGCLEPQDDREPLSVTAKQMILERWRKWKGLV